MNDEYSVKAFRSLNSYSEKIENRAWKSAIATARAYHDKKMRYRYQYGIDYDEKGNEYNSFSDIVKRALNYLCEIGEIN